MTEWIVPLTGILVYLFICSGCFLWIRLYNRKAVTEQGESRSAEGAVLTRLPGIVRAQWHELQGLAGGGL